MDELAEKIIGAAIEVHRTLGPALLEIIYEEALCIELRLRGIPFRRQVGVEVNYKGEIIRGQRVDLIVASQVIVELKSVTALPEVSTAQALTYLQITALKRALFINFNVSKLVDGIKRISL